MKSKNPLRRKAARKSKPPAVRLHIDLPKGELLGAHTSTAGGVTTAVGRAVACGFTTAQIFVKNNKQWFAPPLAEADAAQFRAARKASGILFFAHNSYLVNLGSQNADLFSTSVKAMTAELLRADALGLPFIVMHPGSHGGAGEEEGLRRIAQGLEMIIRSTPSVKCRMALEITAGQGTALGYKLQHLGWLMKAVAAQISSESRLGICLDTAHLFAAGYNIRTIEGYAETMRAIKKEVGLRHILALHLNDSKVALGRRVDRHDHLGRGEIGLECFARIVQDRAWRRVPKVLETPKGEDMREDIENLFKLAPYLQKLA